MGEIGERIGRLLGEAIRSWYRSTLEEDALLAAEIALSYLFLGVLWIVLSDRLVASLADNAVVLSRVQTYKGWAFVLATSVLLYLLIRSAVRARRRLRRRSEETDRFLNTLIENLPGVAYACRDDPEWTMTYMSAGAERLTGYSAEELTASGRPTFGGLIVESDRARVRDEVKLALVGRRPFELEYSIRTKAGDIRAVHEQGRGVYGERGRFRRLEGYIVDVTDVHRVRAGLDAQVARLRSLRAIDLAIMGSLDLRITLEVVLDKVTSSLAVDAAAVMVFDERSEQLRHVAGRGFRGRDIQHSRVRLGEGAAGRVGLEREAMHVPDLRQYSGSHDFSWLPPEDEFVGYLGVPLIAQGELRGVLEILHRAPLEPDDDWLEFLDMLAGQTAIAVDNASMFESLARANTELRIAYDQTIEGWARALDLRDHETEGHSRRVAELTLELAESLGVEGEPLVHIRRGALLHDIGKLGVPDCILLKPGPLTDEERELMCRHAEYSVQLLSPIPFLGPALDIPHFHHEKWDGTGYPDKLAGEAIPLAARIFAVADVWDALRSDRPYRAAWSAERARDYIRDNAGTHFDPDVVRAFLAIDPPEVVHLESRVKTA